MWEDKEKQYGTMKAPGLENLYAVLLNLIKATELRWTTLKYWYALSVALQ